jgi:GTPase SAR1 family protein
MPAKPGKPTYFFKLVLIGDSCVGKTSLLRRFTSDEFEHDAAPTVGVDYATRQVETHDHHTIEAQVWDTGGQERHHSAITAGFYRGVVGALVVFDLTNRGSFEHCQRWLKVRPSSCVLCVMPAHAPALLRQPGTTGFYRPLICCCRSCARTAVTVSHISQ